MGDLEGQITTILHSAGVKDSFLDAAVYSSVFRDKIYVVYDPEQFRTIEVGVNRNVTLGDYFYDREGKPTQQALKEPLILSNPAREVFRTSLSILSWGYCVIMPYSGSLKVTRPFVFESERTLAAYAKDEEEERVNWFVESMRGVSLILKRHYRIYPNLHV